MNIALTALGIGLLVMVGSTQHIPGASQAPPPPANDCSVTVLAEEGTPPPGAPHLDPQKLCDALKRAEQEAGQR